LALFFSFFFVGAISFFDCFDFFAGFRALSYLTLTVLWSFSLLCCRRPRMEEGMGDTIIIILFFSPLRSLLDAPPFFYHSYRVFSSGFDSG